MSAGLVHEHGRLEPCPLPSSEPMDANEPTGQSGRRRVAIETGRNDSHIFNNVRWVMQF